MQESLSESFESRYKGNSGVNGSNTRKRLLSLVRSEMPFDEELGADSSSQRVFIRNKDLFMIYQALCCVDGREPEYLFNGRKLMARKEFEELDSEEDTDSERLRELWTSLGRRGDDR